uniref:hypothetical protein n=1 Tax=Fulvivirga sp. TaxID=1931237 RepID=UPI00404B2D0A
MLSKILKTPLKEMKATFIFLTVFPFQAHLIHAQKVEIQYLITLEDKKILHVGDAKLDVKNLEKFNLAKEDIDVTILPFWQLGPAEQKNIINTYIDPKQILAAHIPPSGQDKAQENIDGLGYENVTILTQQFRTIIVNQ